MRIMRYACAAWVCTWLACAEEPPSTPAPQAPCPAGYATCDAGCADLANDESNCGECGVACEAGFVCNGAGTCALTCQSGLTDCNGVCTNLGVDPGNCGACGNACNTGELCDGSGQCALTCQAGLVDCSGICTDLNTAHASCGECNQPCDSGELCDGAGQCALSCQPSLIDCNGTCVDPLNDNIHCGATGDCQGTNAGMTCTDGYKCDGAGQCALDCQAGFLECNATCIDPLTSNAHCGAVGSCQGPDAGDVCGSGYKCDGAGQCALSCQPGLVDCNGLCIDPLTSNAHCGASGICSGSNQGIACGSGSQCDGSGQCMLSCQPGLLDCGGKCTDPLNSNVHCGATGDCLGTNSGAACGSGFKCDGAGQCSLSCQSGLIDCNGTCVDPQTSNAYCGASADCQAGNAGQSCGAGLVCSSGNCQPTCGPGTTQCGAGCYDLSSSPSHCGACGTVCTSGEACFGGNCVFVGCDWTPGSVAVLLNPPFNQPAGYSFIGQDCDLWVASPYGRTVFRYDFANPTDVQSYYITPGPQYVYGLAYDAVSNRAFAVAPDSAGAKVYRLAATPQTPAIDLNVSGLPGVPPMGMRVAPQGWGSHGGHLIVAFDNGVLAAVDPDTGTATVLASTGTVLSGLGFDGSTLYVGDETNQEIIIVSPTGGVSTFVTMPCGVAGVEVDPGVQLFTGCAFEDEIYQIALPGGALSVIGMIDDHTGTWQRLLQWDGVDTLIISDGESFDFETIEL